MTKIAAAMSTLVCFTLVLGVFLIGGAQPLAGGTVQGSRVQLAPEASTVLQVAHRSPVKRRPCGSWTESGSVRNDTGQAAWIQDADGGLPRQVVAPDASVSFTDRLPARVARHDDEFTVTSLDFVDSPSGWLSGWQFTEPEWLYRPASCRP